MERTTLYRATRSMMGAMCLVIWLLTGCQSVKPGPDMGEELLFVGHDDGDLDIYLTNTLTGQVSQLTQNDRDDIHPVWSADGSRIAYASSEHGLYEIYVMDADGSNKVRITNNEATDTMPSWAPDGQAVVYVSDSEGIEQIRHYDFNTNADTALTASESGAIQPVYAPVGSQVAYLEREGKALRLKTMDSDGGNQSMLIDDLSIITVSWSPDASKIAFAGRSERMTNLYSFELSSGTLVKLTESPDSETSPVWLPDGTSLIYLGAAEARGRAQIHHLDLSDSNTSVRLSESGLEEMNITVSSDGTKVGYVRFEDRFYHTYVMDLSSGTTEKMANELGRSQLTPVFKPSS